MLLVNGSKFYLEYNCFSLLQKCLHVEENFEITICYYIETEKIAA